MKSYKRIIRTYKKYLLTLAIVVISIGGIVFGLVPGFSSLWDRFGKLQSVKKDVYQLERKVQFLSALDETGLDNSVSVLTSAVPTDSNYPSILMLVEALAGQQGLSISGFSVTGGSLASSSSAKLLNKSDTKLGSYVVPFEFSMKGPLDKIRSVLESSLTVRRLIRFDTLGVGLGMGIATQSGDLTTSITGSVFFQPLPKTMGAAKDMLPEVSSAEQEILSKISQYPDISFGLNGQAASQLSPFFDPNRSDPFAP